LNNTEQIQAHWKKNLRMTSFLLSLWFVVTFVIGFYAAELEFILLGWPFAFWMGAQGALLVFLLIVAFYAYYMNKQDKLMKPSSGGDTNDASTADGD